MFLLSGSRHSGAEPMRIGSCRYVTSHYLHYIHALLIPSCNISTPSGKQSYDCNTKDRERKREKDGEKERESKRGRAKGKKKG